ncbi:hypothetical protein [Streptomyces microflavus]|uniref:hypothetical protein n=1 Tax=Streptomyces microflavus TaxID=1919 RepID=UPI0033E2A1E4
MQVELLVQLIEEVSLLASDRRRTEPRTITRPFGTSPAPGVPTVNTPAQQPAPMNGHRKMLAAAARRGMVRSNG